MYDIGGVMIDSHIHSDTRPYEDFEKMAMCFDCAITLAHDPLEPYSMDILRAHFDKILYNEVGRANKNGLKLFVCLGIHPRMIPPDVNYNVLREYLKNENIVFVFLGVKNEEEHKKRFYLREKQSSRKAEKYLKHFKEIREIHDYILEDAKKHNFPIIYTTNVRENTNKCLMCLLEEYKKRDQSIK